MPEQFHSEDRTDVWLSESGLLPERGFYIDIGCAHPFRYSNTAFLRNRGWTGLAIDGDPAYAVEWRDMPNATFINCVMSSRPMERFLIEPTNALVSRVHDGGLTVQAFTLQHIINDNGVQKIDLLALDIEGMEYDVLEHYLGGAYPEILPPVIVAEYNSMHKGCDHRLFNIFARNRERYGYDLVHMTPSNAIFSL